MKQMGIFDAKNRFSEVCETVARTSEPVVVTRRGVPLVRVVPVGGNTSVWDTVAESEARHGPLSEDLELPERSRRRRPDPLA